MFKLLIFGVLWLMAIAMLVTAAAWYFTTSEYFSHEETMYDKKHDE